MEWVLQIEHGPERERARCFPAGDQQRVEHPAAMFLVIRQAAKEHGRALGSGRDVDRIGRSGASASVSSGDHKTSRRSIALGSGHAQRHAR